MRNNLPGTGHYAGHFPATKRPNAFSGDENYPFATYRAAAELTPQRAAPKLAVFMLDGYLARYRGRGWGKKKTKKKRVEWHEMLIPLTPAGCRWPLNSLDNARWTGVKGISIWHEIKTGVFYLQEQAARTEGGRGILSEKVVVCWQGEGVEVGRRLH